MLPDPTGGADSERIIQVDAVLPAPISRITEHHGFDPQLRPADRGDPVGTSDAGMPAATGTRTTRSIEHTADSGRAH